MAWLCTGCFEAPPASAATVPTSSAEAATSAPIVRRPRRRAVSGLPESTVEADEAVSNDI
jgi:hypothetical protein